MIQIRGRPATWEDRLDIQEEILLLPATTDGRDPIKQADLRPVAKVFDWNMQRQIRMELKTLWGAGAY